MKLLVQARLSDSERAVRSSLSRQPGWPPSQIVREGIRLVAACYPAPPRKKIAGLGKFSSGIADLGSKKRHLRDFGKRGQLFVSDRLGNLRTGGMKAVTLGELRDIIRNRRKVGR